MIAGYNEFAADVQAIFAATIREAKFKLVTAEYAAVVLENAKVQLGFSIQEETMRMSVKSGGQYYDVAELIMLIDKNTYVQWESQRAERSQHLSRDAYYKTYLHFYHLLSDKYLLSAYSAGVIPAQVEYDTLRQVRAEYQKKYSIAWKAMHELAYEHPIRQKYIFADQSWVDDMLKSIENKQ